MGNEQSNSTQTKMQLCEEEMNSYIICVNKHNEQSGGLRDGNDCELEAEIYRECRRKIQSYRKSNKKD